jgi:hypothetical protein
MGNRDQYYEALHEFIGNNYKDPKAAVIFTGKLVLSPTWASDTNVAGV